MLSFAKRTLLFYSPLLLCLSLGTVQAKPNVLWLLVEGLETKALNPGGLPALVSLAEKGVVFNRAYGASPSSNASRTAMMTGQLPSSNGVWSDGDDPRRSLALEGRLMAPEQFKKMGWLTLAAGEIFHATAGGADQRMGDRRGYEVDAAWDERFPGDGVQRPQEPADPVPTFDVPAEAGETEVAAKAGVTKSGNAQIAEWVADRLVKPQGKKPFVMMVGLSAGGADGDLNAALEEITTALESGPAGAETMVIICGDRGKAEGGDPALNCVPLLVVAPGKEYEAGRCEAVVSLVDLYPTALEWLQLKKPEGLDGASLLPLLKDLNAGRDGVAVVCAGAIVKPTLTAIDGEASLTRNPEGQEERVGQGDFDRMAAALPTDLNLYARPATDWVGPMRQEGGFDLTLQLGDRLAAEEMPSARGCSLLIEASLDYDPKFDANATLVTHGTPTLGYAFHFVEGKATLTLFHEGTWTSVSTHSLEKGSYHLRAAVDGGGLVSIAIPDSAEMLAAAPFPDGFPSDLGAGLRTDAGVDLLRPGWFPAASVYHGSIKRLRLCFLTVVPADGKEAPEPEAVPLRAIPVE